LPLLRVVEAGLQRFDCFVDLGARRRDGIQVHIQGMVVHRSQRTVRRMLKSKQHLQTILVCAGNQLLCKQTTPHGLLMHILEAVAGIHQPPEAHAQHQNKGNPINGDEGGKTGGDADVVQHDFSQEIISTHSFTCGISYRTGLSSSQIFHADAQRWHGG